MPSSYFVVALLSPLFVFDPQSALAFQGLLSGPIRSAQRQRPRLHRLPAENTKSAALKRSGDDVQRPPPSGDESFSLQKDPPADPSGIIGAVYRLLGRAFKFKDMRREIREGGDIVPLIGARPGWAAIRENMFRKGVYPGVDYRVERIDVRANGDPIRDAVITVRPRYRLVDKLERQWPVTIAMSEVPIFLTPRMYNTATLISTLLSAAQLLAVALVASQFCSLYYIPSYSMEPTLHKGDVLLVEKVSRLVRPPKNGDIVLFNPPEQLRTFVRQAGGQLAPGDLFVKRVAATQGDRVTVDNGLPTINGHTYVYPEPEEPPTIGSDAPPARADGSMQRLAIGRGFAWPYAGEAPSQWVADECVLGSGAVYVLGDNPVRSVDSRLWGELRESEIVGHPVIRLFPWGRFGPVR
ncbi:unnamed protein product [Vitrella brassicaformis CCMP3155]|uniref:Mitochondrial inner membrane protease subunit n=1 Tax=Vitrella brassicaformis (strain CCMP3155) TaxID=1169540 RepID=A0A0G4EFP7_VITBC|nr:unnamed protein product [Vitrella brassicaformis CCMP3155]|eukprot:CEL94229.1 unnamed protein product [Vitrella brassicaformis CCMP3155]